MIQSINNSQNISNQSIFQSNNVSINQPIFRSADYSINVRISIFNCSISINQCQLNKPNYWPQTWNETKCICGRLSKIRSYIFISIYKNVTYMKTSRTGKILLESWQEDNLLNRFKRKYSSGLFFIFWTMLNKPSRMVFETTWAVSNRRVSSL